MTSNPDPNIFISFVFVFVLVSGMDLRFSDPGVNFAHTVRPRGFAR